MTITQTSSAVANGDTVRHTDHNKLVTDVAALITSENDGGPDGAVTTAKIAANAVTQVGYADTTGDFTCSSTSFVDITGLSFSITTTGGHLRLEVLTGKMYGSAAQVTLAVQINGVDYPVAYANNLSGGNAFSGMYGFYILTGLAAGTYTVKGRVKVSTGSVQLNDSAAARMSVCATEYKR